MSAYSEIGSTYSDGHNNYDLNKLFKLTQSVKIQKVALDRLIWLLDCVDPLDPVRVNNSDHNVPILITHYEDKLVVVDGIHRLMKAYLLGCKDINCKYVTREQMISSITEGRKMKNVYKLNENEIRKMVRKALKESELNTLQQFDDTRVSNKSANPVDDETGHEIVWAAGASLGRRLQGLTIVGITSHFLKMAPTIARDLRIEKIDSSYPYLQDLIDVFEQGYLSAA